MSGSGQNGAGGQALVLTKANKREGLALPIEEEDELETLDTEALCEWMLDKSGPHMKKQQCVLFTLSHDHKTGGIRQLTSSSVIDKKLSPGDRQTIVESIVREWDYLADKTAKGFPDTQRFWVFAYKTEGADPEERKDGAEFSWLFLIEPPESAKFGSGQAYGDPMGGSIDVVTVVQTAMKGMQEQSRQNNQNMQQCMDRLANQCDGLLSHVEKVMSERYDNAVKMEKSLDDRSRREAEARDQNMKTDAMFMLFQGGFEFAKSFGARWMAARERQLNMGADPETVDAPFVKLAKTLEPEQLIGIASVLSPEQQRDFAPMVDKIVYGMPPEKQELVGALFGAWRDSIDAQAQAAKKAASDPAVKVTVTETPRAADPKTDPKSDPKPQKGASK